MAKKDPDKYMGKKFTDTITGFEGTCTAVSYFINGCVQLHLEPSSKDNEVKEPVWFDEQRIEAVPARQQATAGGGHGRPRAS